MAGAGPRQRAPEVRFGLFEYFVDIRNSLKGRLPKKLFLAKARIIYEAWVQRMEKEGKEIGKPLTFTRCWLQGWCNEFNITSKHPNKRMKLKAVE